MTELEAINTLLGIIGEAPIDHLSDLLVNEITDSTMARRTLQEVSRDVQSEGWSWNTDDRLALAKDAQGQFLLPDNALKAVFSPNRYPQRQYVQRGRRIWDKQKRTFAFGADMAGSLVVDSVVFELEWDELPHVAQQYITIRAGRVFSNRYVNSTVVYSFTTQDEEYARTMLVRGEEESGRNNLLWGNDRGNDYGIGYTPGEGMMYRRV